MVELQLDSSKISTDQVLVSIVITSTCTDGEMKIDMIRVRPSASRSFVQVQTSTPWKSQMPQKSDFPDVLATRILDQNNDQKWLINSWEKNRPQGKMEYMRRHQMLQFQDERGQYLRECPWQFWSLLPAFRVEWEGSHYKRYWNFILRYFVNHCCATFWYSNSLYEKMDIDKSIKYF